MKAFTHWKWRLDEVYVKINGEVHYLWRAVDHEGEVLESFATKERDKHATFTFMRKLMRRHGSAKTITTDGLRSYKAAMKDIGNADKQEIGRWANNRPAAEAPFSASLMLYRPGVFVLVRRETRRPRQAG